MTESYEFEGNGINICHKVNKLIDVSKALNIESINLSHRENLGLVPTNMYT